MESVKPVLKWVGGKTQILQEVLSGFPTTRPIHNYHEPFVGGGSVLLEVLRRQRAGLLDIEGSIYASDLNRNLIGLYRNIQSDPHALITELEKLTTAFNPVPIVGTVVHRNPTSLEEATLCRENFYFWTRKQFNELSEDDRVTPRGSAMLLFLNKTCFRGLYREGPRGFNVPYGNYKNPAIYDPQHILDISALLQPVQFACASFDESLARVTNENDFTYLDPPYAPVSETSFVGYTTDGFGPQEHRRLFEFISSSSVRGKILMSNADTPLVRSAFPAPTFQTRTILCRRAIHSKKPGSQTNELLISNF